MSREQSRLWSKRGSKPSSKQSTKCTPQGSEGTWRKWTCIRPKRSFLRKASKKSSRLTRLLPTDRFTLSLRTLITGPRNLILREPHTSTSKGDQTASLTSLTAFWKSKAPNWTTESSKSREFQARISWFALSLKLKTKMPLSCLSTTLLEIVIMTLTFSWRMEKWHFRWVSPLFSSVLAKAAWQTTSGTDLKCFVWPTRRLVWWWMASLVKEICLKNPSW